MQNIKYQLEELFTNTILTYKTHLEVIINNDKQLLKTLSNSDIYSVTKAKLLYNILMLDVLNNYINSKIIDQERIQKVNDQGITLLEISSIVSDEVYLKTANNVKDVYDILQLLQNLNTQKIKLLNIC
jgi:hypothetical protein